MKTSKRESIAQKKSFLSAALELAEYTVEHLDSDGEGSSEESALEMDMNSDSDVFDDNNEEERFHYVMNGSIHLVNRRHHRNCFKVEAGVGTYLPHQPHLLIY